MPPEPPLGPRHLDLAGLSAEDFETFCHRLVRAAYPLARRLRPPDRGADSLLPSADGGWSQAWQYKRFAGSSPHWRQCEQSFDDAVDSWGVKHVVFCFPRDLTGTQEAEFRRRFSGRREGVSADWWGMTELHAQAEATPEGRLAVRWAFGPTREEEREATLETVALAGELEGVSDVLARLRKLGQWLARRDEHFAYTAHTWEAGQAEPNLPAGTVMSVLESDGDVVERVDAVARETEGDAAKEVSLRILLAPDESGRRAIEALDEATRTGTRVRLKEGVSVAFDAIPSLFAEADLDDTEPLAVILEPLPPPPPASIPASLTIVGEGGQQETLDLNLDGLSVAREPYELVWRGASPGLEVTLAVRRKPEGGGETSIDAKSGLSEVAPIREQLRALRFLHALHSPGELRILDRSRPGNRLSITLARRAPDKRLSGLIAVLEALVLIEDWSGERFTLPSEARAEEVNEILAVAAGLRAGSWPVKVGEILIPAEQAPDQERAFFLQEEVGYPILGRDVWLGTVTVRIPDVEVSESTVPGKVIVRSREGSPTFLPGRLQPGRLSTTPLPEPFEGIEAEHNRSPGQGG